MVTNHLLNGMILQAITETKRKVFRFHETILRFGDWITRAQDPSHYQVLFPRLPNTWWRRYLDPKNIPKTPSQEVFGSLGITCLASGCSDGFGWLDFHHRDRIFVVYLRSIDGTFWKQPTPKISHSCLKKMVLSYYVFQVLKNRGEIIHEN